MMKVLLLLSIFIVTIICQETIPKDSCSLCTLLVDGLENMASKQVSKADLMKELDVVQFQVCTKIPQGNDFLTPEQCSTYVQLYGPYVVDLLMETTKTSAVCSTLGLCQDSNGADQFEIILPTITSDMVEYDVKETVISSTEQQFRYKMFLGNPSFPGFELFTVEVIRGQGCSLNFELTNKSIEQPYDFVSEFEGPVSILEPGRGVWYYLTVEASELDENNTCTFSMISTIQSAMIVQTSSHSIILISPIIFVVVALAAFCCCCCAIRRRKCKSQCRMQTPTNDLALDVKSVELAQMQNPTPVGYFYVPATGQYVQVPQIPQQMAYPEYYVVQQE